MGKIYDADIPSPAHLAILSRLTPGSRVLDVGCATGFLSGLIQRGLGCEVVGVEMTREAADLAVSRCANVIVGDINREETWRMAGGKFDFIVFGDVLEHLADPWEVLRTAGSFLSEGGRVIATVPNVAFRKVRLGLLLGRFDYTDSGTLDDTHLRFFTNRSAWEMLERAGYCVSALIPIFKGHRDAIPGKFFPGLFAYQLLVEGYVADGGE